MCPTWAQGSEGSLDSGSVREAGSTSLAQAPALTLALLEIGLAILRAPVKPT